MNSIAEVSPVVTKVCTGCNEHCSIDAFQLCTRKRGGARREARCKRCVSIAQKAKRADKAVRDLANGIRRKRRHENPFPFREASLDSYRRARALVIEKLGGKCQHCGITDSRVLQIDHVHGGGGEDRRKNGNGYALMRRAMLDTEGEFQLLCANCNFIKRMTSPAERSGPKSKSGQKHLRVANGRHSDPRIQHFR
jgi:hypothetical protein